jgi:hypothetical protein
MKQQQQEIRPGNLVRLNSGSPDLKVIAVSEKVIEVEWNDNGETKTSTFSSACLALQPNPVVCSEAV